MMTIFCGMQVTRMFNLKNSTLETIKKLVTPSKRFEVVPVPDLSINLNTLFQRHEIEGQINDIIALAQHMVGRALLIMFDDVFGQYLDIYEFLHKTISMTCPDSSKSEHIQALEMSYADLSITYVAVTAWIFVSPDQVPKSAREINEKYLELAGLINMKNGINDMVDLFQQYLATEKEQYWALWRCGMKCLFNLNWL